MPELGQACRLGLKGHEREEAVVSLDLEEAFYALTSMAQVRKKKTSAGRKRNQK